MLRTLDPSGPSCPSSHLLRCCRLWPSVPVWRIKHSGRPVPRPARQPRGCGTRSAVCPTCHIPETPCSCTLLRMGAMPRGRVHAAGHCPCLPPLPHTDLSLVMDLHRLLPCDMVLGRHRGQAVGSPSPLLCFSFGHLTAMSRQAWLNRRVASQCAHVPHIRLVTH